MDEIELLVAETMKHFDQNFTREFEDQGTLRFDTEDETPRGPGVLYHIQRSSSVFVIRTFVSKNIRDDYRSIISGPENYPSLRLIEASDKQISEKLRYFLVDDHLQAEIIHDQLNNRRFPINEEMMCNLSDPGFSWWLSKKSQGFQLSFTLSVRSEDTSVKLGPLGDQQLAICNFQNLSALLELANIPLSIQTEMNRVHFSEEENILSAEFHDLFEYGVINQTLIDLFKLLSYKLKDHSMLETVWYYFQELAAMRRFWIQIQYDLN